MVADDAVEAFARDGVVVVRGLVTPSELEMIGVGISKVLADRSAAATAQPDPHTAEIVVEDFSRWGDVDEISKLALRSGVPRVAAELMDSPTARFYHDHVLVKEPGDPLEARWRQDRPYYNVDGRGISAWIAIDSVPKDGSPEFWAGSHLGPWRVPAEQLDEAGDLPSGTVSEMPDIEHDRSRYDIRRWDLSPGDVVFYDFGVVHSVPGTGSEQRRRVLTLHYLSTDARHAERPWPTWPEFPGLAKELSSGAEFDHPYFPLAWPR